MIDGHRYFYKSQREGGRVTTTYYGAGETAEAIILILASEREEREIERMERQAEREESDAEERAIAAWFDDVQAVADAAMRAAGYHKHKGQWRRKRP
jgi:molecular chaperone GrpE (heat shock protein)